MKTWHLLLLFLGSAFGGQAQICLGNSTQALAAMFDPNWIYGCATGTSCSGGVQFTNLAACEPVTTMDPCAPAPTGCGSATNGSDLWFKFYASSTTATINVIQNTSLVAAVQAFSGSTDCSSLTQIGCNIAGGPSSGVQLVLNGLVAGELYYFRVYGSSNNASQRTGLYCFCGTTGLTNTPLPVQMQLRVQAQTGLAALAWTVTDGESIDLFEVERGLSVDALHSIMTIPHPQSGAISNYSWQDPYANAGRSYYRIKAVDRNGGRHYSNIVEVQIEADAEFQLLGNVVHDFLKVRSGTDFQAQVINVQGAVVAAQSFAEGENQMDVLLLPAGVYFFKNLDEGIVCRFVVQH